MTEVLHALAVAPAALGTCCVAADRARLRLGDLWASILMTLAMVDAATVAVVPAVWWATALAATAIGMAVSARVRRRARSTGSTEDGMAVHTGMGLIAMAGLLMMMTPSVAPTVHDHHGSLSFAPLILAATFAYAAASIMLALRCPRLQRLQVLAMGASTVLMGVSALA